MERQRGGARRLGGLGRGGDGGVWFALREKLGATEFLGYETETAEGVVRRW
jgi:alanyl-tRNA synthetase